MLTPREAACYRAGAAAAKGDYDEAAALMLDNFDVTEDAEQPDPTLDQYDIYVDIPADPTLMPWVHAINHAMGGAAPTALEAGHTRYQVTGVKKIFEKEA